MFLRFPVCLLFVLCLMSNYVPCTFAQTNETEKRELVGVEKDRILAEINAKWEAQTKTSNIEILSKEEQNKILDSLRKNWKSQSQNFFSADISFLNCRPIPKDIKPLSEAEVIEITEYARKNLTSPREIFDYLFTKLIVDGDKTDVKEKYISKNHYYYENKQHREDRSMTISSGPAKGEIVNDSYVFDGKYNFIINHFNHDVKVFNPADFHHAIANIGYFRPIPLVMDDAKVSKLSQNFVSIEDESRFYVVDTTNALFQVESLFDQDDISRTSHTMQIFMFAPCLLPYDFALSQVSLSVKYDNQKLNSLHLACAIDLKINEKLPSDTFTIAVPKGYIVWDYRNGIESKLAFQTEKDEHDVLLFLDSFNQSLPVSKKNTQLWKIVIVNIVCITCIVLLVLRKKYKKIYD